MIIKDTETLREYLSVNGSVDHENIAPYLKKAERNLLKPLIGATQLAIFDAEQTDETIIYAQELAQEAVANFGYYMYLPIGAVQISDSGIHVVDIENTKAASDKQFKELQRSFKKSGHEALDELLEYMEENPSRFEAWTTSPNYTVFKELLVNTTAIFNKWFYIFNSRQTFVALKPNLQIVEDRFIKNVLGIELLTALKTTQTVTERKEVKELARKAIVAFTIMLTVDNGMFVFDAQGIHMRFDALPYESTATNSTIKVNDFLTRTKANKQTEGEEYLKLALKIIEANPSKFTEYAAKETPDHVKLTVTKSIVGM